MVWTSQHVASEGFVGSRREYEPRGLHQPLTGHVSVLDRSHDLNDVLGLREGEESLPNRQRDALSSLVWIHDERNRGRVIA